MFVCGGLMTVFDLDKWWKRKDHRKIRGPRGARFASLKFHAVFLVSIVGLVEYVFRSTDGFTARHFADPPVPPPPPMAKSLGYSLTSEMPHLKSLETEARVPAHLPQREGLNYKLLREEGKMA